MKKYIISCLVILSVAFIGYVAGIYTGKKGISYALNLTQGILAFNHFREYQEIKFDLEKGCLKESLQKLDYAIEREMTSLAEYVQYSQMEELNSYIDKRDKTLLEKLKAYEFDRYKRWTLDSCKK